MSEQDPLRHEPGIIAPFAAVRVLARSLFGTRIFPLVARLKIVIHPDPAGKDKAAPMRTFYQQLDQQLRRASRGRAWATEGARSGSSASGPSSGSTATYLCQVHDLSARMPLIQNLLEDHDLLGRASLYREEPARSGWKRIEASATSPPSVPTD